MRIGILGSGTIVKEFLSIVHELPEVKVVAIIGLAKSIEKLNGLKTKYEIGKVYVDYDEALGDDDIDFIYVALPNNLHYWGVKKALMANKNVICEKPFMSDLEQTNEVISLAKENNLYLFEAITNQFLPNYRVIKNRIGEIGQVKIVQCNFTHYSSKYEKFKNGIIHPAFDHKCSGGALMDLNVYNIYFVIGIFGAPSKFQYYPNINKNIDTSGILVLEYDGFHAVCIGSKDSQSESSSYIQGETGFIKVDGPANSCCRVHICDESYVDDTHRMYYEFKEFERIYSKKDYKAMHNMLDLSRIVMEVLSKSKI